MLINTDHFTSKAEYSSFNSAEAAHGVNYHGREYDYIVSHLVIWFSPKGVSSIESVSTSKPRNEQMYYHHFYLRLSSEHADWVMVKRAQANWGYREGTHADNM